ncbi:MAG TPA: VOC family protein [Chloroflexota bacterium]|nr:VOC family protein [Chloroflexota bacterium]
MKTRAIDFVVYAVPDMQQASSFYRDTLGIDFPLVEEGDFWTEFDTPPVALALCRPKSKGKYAWSGPAAVGLAVDDVYAAMEELRAKGVKILNEPVRTNVCVMGFIEDPFGNRICIHQRHDGTAG